MLPSIAFVLLLGFVMGELFAKLRLPRITGMIIAGVLLGAVGALDESLLNISAELRKIALIIILTRAGLNLELADLKKAGRPAVLLCFVPAVFEMAGTILLAPALLGLSRIEAAVLGAVLAAVSPAVIVPKMLALMEQKRGTAKCIPQMILAGASVDDVFVIVMFSVFTGIEQGGGVDPMSFVNIPISIILGTAAGAACGALLCVLFKKVHIRDSCKVIIVLSTGFLLTGAETALTGIIGFSGLIAVMAAGMTCRIRLPEASKRVSAKFGKLWTGAEIILFVLVGAQVDISNALNAGIAIPALILAVLVFRSAGVLVCLIKTRLNLRERLFCAAAYTPKATVQAAIGGTPLAMGLACGQTVLSAAVLAILLTATLGSFLIDLLGRRCLSADE